MRGNNRNLPETLSGTHIPVTVHVLNKFKKRERERIDQLLPGSLFCKTPAAKVIVVRSKGSKTPAAGRAHCLAPTTGLILGRWRLLSVWTSVALT